MLLATVMLALVVATRLAPVAAACEVKQGVKCLPPLPNVGCCGVTGHCVKTNSTGSFKCPDFFSLACCS